MLLDSTMSLERIRRFIRRYHWTIMCIRCKNFNRFRHHYTKWYHNSRTRSVGIAGGSIEEDIRMNLDVEPDLSRENKLI